jgi:hypothetical protein
VNVVVKNRLGMPGASLDWIVARDGDGPWRVVPSSASGYEFEVTQGRYALATVCLPTGAAELIAATVSELPRVILTCFDPTAGPTYRLTGTLVGARNVAPSVGFGGVHGYFHGQTAGTPSAYSADLPQGTYDAVARDTGLRPGRVLLRREVRVEGPSTLDWDFGQAIMLQAAPAPIGLMGGETPLTATMLHIPGRGTVSITAGGRDLLVLPSSSLQAGEVQEASVLALNYSPHTQRAVMRAWQGDGPPTLTLPPGLGEVSLKAPGGSALGATVTLEPYPSVTFYQLILQDSKRPGPTWFVALGAGWVAGRPSFELPDPGSAPGFRPEWLVEPAGAGVVFAALVTSRGFANTLSARDFTSRFSDQHPPAPGSEVTYTDRRGLTIETRMLP